MENHWVIKLIIYAFMLSIVYALGSGLYFILYKKGESEKAVKSLTARIGLSFALFVLIIIAIAMGWLKPHGLIPTGNIQKQTETTIPHPQNANTKPPLQKQNDAQE